MNFKHLKNLRKKKELKNTIHIVPKIKTVTSIATLSLYKKKIIHNSYLGNKKDRTRRKIKVGKCCMQFSIIKKEIFE